MSTADYTSLVNNQRAYFKAGEDEARIVAGSS